MHDVHPNMERMQRIWDAMARGDPEPAIAILSERVVVENGPGAGPWHHVEGRDIYVDFAFALVSLFGDSWHQSGTCVYADDRISISLVREVGTSSASGHAFENLAIWITRFGADGEVDRVWAVDVDHEACEDFWEQENRSRRP